ncbi:MAG: ATP-binding cassette domain-containing protein [Prolixibacteraceae bacterium]|nr:ATP-binding cassette domain-containing protein [Prolixibacteraceae bacterium]MBN2774400.1 ATP-binding cassette domain-containing protein [Prolixibacteraceae bacterium]
MKPVIEIINASFAYDKVVVLENVNLQVFEKDFIGIIGPNGGGKTTLLKGILGLLKPVKGSVSYPGKIYSTHKPFGYLPQVKHIDKKFPITVIDVVRSGAVMKRNLFHGRNEEKEKALQLLNEMGVADIQNKAIGELSGGQMQRVFLCRALISEPEVLILDEPDTFVDNRFEGELYEKLKILNERVAIILVSHDLGTISTYVKTIACINREFHYHRSNKISTEQLKAYNCPIQIITHGEVPHTVLKYHD